MKFTTHLSRKQVEKNRLPKEFADDTALISICDPYTPPPRVLDVGYKHIIMLRFHDIVSPYDGYEMPTIEHAKKIVAFVEEHKDKSILVHCEAGISRSAAVCHYLKDLGWEYIAPHKFGLTMHNKTLRALIDEASKQRG